MPSKLQFYAQMADHTAEQITGSYQKWTAFLTTAARLYKYPYHEQLMIFAQRPEATACADYDLWNKQMRRYVRQGSKGIALIDTTGDQPRLKYVFDVSDTGGGENSRRPFLWAYRPEHQDAVTAALARRFEVSGENGLANQLERVAAQLVDEFWNVHQRDILDIVADSFLEEYDDFNIGVAFRNAAVVSTTYMLLSRCGMEPGEYFEHEDFLNVFDFNTPQTVAALGTAVSQSSEQVLRQIEVTIKNYERQKLAERSESHERADLREERGLPDSRPEPVRAEAAAPGQVRQDAEAIPSGASSGALEQPAAVREAVPPSAGDRRGSEPASGADDARADAVGGRDGGTESQRPDAVGGPNEHAESAGRGNDSDRAGVRIIEQPPIVAVEQISLFPSEAEQIEIIMEAESAQAAPFASSLPQEDIDHLLRLGSNTENAHMKIVNEFMKQKPLSELTAFVTQTYHDGYGLKTGNGSISSWADQDGLHITRGTSVRYARTAQVLSWEDATARIGELLEQGHFATNVELTEAPGFERQQVAQSLWYLCQDMSDEARKQEWLPTIRENRKSGFPEDVARLEKLLEDPDSRQTIAAELDSFALHWRQNPSAMRFRIYKPDVMLQRVNELSIPRRRYPEGMTELPAVPSFITEDEIDATLSRSGSFEGGAGRIYSFWQQEHTPKEKADFLKHEYGTGGGNNKISHNFSSWEDHNSKGIVLRKPDAENVTLSWAKVAKRIDAMVAKDRYLTPEAKAAWEQAQTVVEAAPMPQPPSVQPLIPAAQELTQEDIDDALRKWNGNPESKRAVVRYMGQHGREKDTAAWLSREYGGDPSKPLHFTLAGTDTDVVMPWPKVQRRIAQLIKEDRFFTEEEQNRFDDIDPVAIREALEQRGIVDGQVVDPEKLEQDPFIRQVTADVERITQEEQAQAPILSGQPITRQGDTITIGEGDAIHEIDITVTAEELQHIQEAVPDTSAPNYKVGDTVYLDDKPFEITEVGDFNVQLRDPSLAYPIFRSEAKEHLLELAAQDDRNVGIFFPDVAAWEKERREQIEAIVSALTPEQQRIVQATHTGGFEFDPLRANPPREALIFRSHGDDYPVAFENWEDAYAWIDGAELRDYPGLREQVQQVLHPEPVAPEITSEPVAVYPGEKNGLPYDVVVERLHIDGPEHDPPKQAVPGAAPGEEAHGTPVAIPIDGAWQTFPDVASAEKAAYEEAKAEVRRNAQNFHITDDALGVGGPKAKYQSNINAIKLLKYLEAEGSQAIPEQQEVLSRYVGWGGLADVFDPSKEKWSAEYAELKNLLTPEEYEAARASTLNAHYTSPTVIRAIYEVVGNMGFKAGNILEPSMGVGNFFGMLPEEMRNSRLYGVELDSITGRIAKQLYPKADITVAGFETTDRRDFFDLAVGNVPFGQYQVNDRAYNKLGFSIHDYFFAKTLDQVRPGGVIAFVTSRYTMDKQSPEVRRYIAQRAELLGAIRLPNNAFRANAGTDVVSDIIFLQKRDRPIDIEPDWVHLGQNEDGFAINSYFVDHPEMILGRQTSESTQYGRQDFTVAPIEGLELADQLHDAVKYIRGTYQEAELPDLGDGEAIDTSIPADPNVKNYSYAVVDGEVYFRENSRMVKPDLNATARERVKGLVELRECVQRLIDLQMGDADDVSIRQEQARLNQLYDAFSEKYGLINSRGNALAFSDDSSYYLLCSLEVLDEEGRFERKADMFTKRTIKQHTAVTSVDTASEALAVSISEKACVDMEYMSQLTGKDEQTLAAELRGVVFLDFDTSPGGTGIYRTADDFLSGNVREKLRKFEQALETLSTDDPRRTFAQANVEALKVAQTKDLEASEIDVRLGATWVDKNYIQQFMYELLDTPYHLKRAISVNFSEFTAEWNITGKSAVSYNDVATYTTYGTERANAYRILEDSLNLRDVRIYDTLVDPDGKERRILNQKETTLAQQKQQAIKDAFQDWIWKDPQRRQALVQKYNELFNSNRLREYDGSHITFGGINPEIQLRPHQLNAIAHVLYGGNTLLAHEVGAGKTFEMVAAAMESKRLGLCQKSLFVVPNHLTEQWASEFLRLYPSANILVATRKDFETRNRKKFCSRIATGDYDAVIIGHSQFERIPVSAERQERLLQEQIWEIEDGLKDLKRTGAERFTIKQLEKTKKSLEAKLEKLNKGDRKDDVVTFEQLGVDRLFVDEAHSYKNLFLYTKMRNVAGISTTEAQKSSDMLLKCRYLDEITGGKGVVFATGTPVSNSMTELYTMMRYLQHDMLQRNHLTHFDNWASIFGETTTAIELAPEGTGYRARTRFAKFFNLPELMTLWKETADIKTADQLQLPTPEVIYHNEVAHPTEHQKEMVQELSSRAADVHAGLVEPWKDNMLKITSDGRKLGLDQRILNPLLPDDPGSKVNQCVENITRIWQDGQADKLTQLVFCDISTPKAAPSQRAAKASPGNLDNPELRALEMLTEPANTTPTFSVYDDIRSKLIARGIPAEQIAFIHDANTEARKKELFAKVRSGQVRVLMGSTFKMGAGMNVQDRLIALHDLDCPWRPGDLEQRKGRIVRQGNHNPTVHIYRYVTEGTFDSYIWQTVENKQKFISQIMTSKSPVRSCEDIDETALSYAEIKALCAGDPRIKEKMDLDIDVSRLKLLKANHQSQQYRLEDNLLKYFPEQIEQNKGFIAGFQTDMETLAANQPPEGEFAGMVIRGDILTDKDNAGAAILETCKEFKSMEPTEIGTYRGFTMSLSFMGLQYQLTLKGAMTHRIDLGTDARGNLIRIENALAQMPERLKAVQAQLDDLYQQQAAAKAELDKPFPQEAELQQKSARLAELNALLDMGTGKSSPQKQDAQRTAKSERSSVLDRLKTPTVHGSPDKSHKKEMEAR